MKNKILILIVMLALAGCVLKPDDPAQQPPPAIERITIKGTDFYCGSEKFIPIGNNYVRLAAEFPVWNHSTFERDFYDHRRAETVLNRMRRWGYNAVRAVVTYTDNGFGWTVGASDDYMRNLSDFLSLAAENKIYVMVVGTGYLLGYGRNDRILKLESVDAFCRIWNDFLKWFEVNEPDLLNVIFSLDLYNEMRFYSINDPFDKASGFYTAANGRTYNLATEKNQLKYDATLYFVNRLMETVAGRVLASCSVYFSQESVPLAALDNSEIDYMDLHIYIEGRRTLGEAFWDDALLKLRHDKPLISGEFGVNRDIYPDIDEAGERAKYIVLSSYQYGFQGWLLWTWDCQEQDLNERWWLATMAGNAMNQALTEVYRELGLMEE